MSIASRGSMMPGSFAEMIVDLGAIERNWRVFEQLGEAASAAVVKADGYGTGATKVVSRLHEAGCRAFFVATTGEGAELRSVTDSTIYVLSGVVGRHDRELDEFDLTPVLNSIEQVERWSWHSWSQGSRRAALHIDTGINRLGIDHRDLVAVQDELSGSQIQVDLVMSHLACADQPDHPLNSIQLERFATVASSFAGVPASLCGSGGALLGSDYHFDLLRPGLALYGGNAPTRPGVSEPVVSVLAPILQIHELEIGDTAGYGATFRSRERRVLATVGAGYADGFSRSLSNRGRAVVGGVEVPYAGVVSMDSILLDVTSVGPISDHLVELVGERITVDRLAELAGTIPNEILTGLGGRLLRSYVG